MGKCRARADMDSAVQNTSGTAECVCRDGFVRCGGRAGRVCHIGVLSLVFIACTILLTSCMPPGYTSAKKKEVKKAHSEEAKEWFSENLKEARVRSADAYANGIDLFAVIEGTYSYEGDDYPYFYDYHNKNMYLGHEYEKMADRAKEKIERELGAGGSYVDLYTAGFAFETIVENDKGGEYPNSAEAGSTREINLQRILPAGSDSDLWSDKLLYEENECFGLVYVTIYTDGGEDSIPPYDGKILEKLKGVRCIEYIRPAKAGESGMYKAWYGREKRVYSHLVMEDVADGTYAGYAYSVTENLDENGDLTDREDPMADYESEGWAKDLGDGSIEFRIPPSSHFFILSEKKGKYQREVRYSSGESKLFELKRFDKYAADHDRSLEEYREGIILPKSRMEMYCIQDAYSDEETYRIIMP